MHAVRIMAMAAALLMAGGTAALAQVSTVNISVITSSVDKHLITQVEIAGPGGGTYIFADPFTAPDLSDPDIALVEALAWLGLPLDTPLGSLSSILIGTDAGFQETVISNFNPVEHPTIVLGDPDNYLTWVAIADQDVNVEAHQVTTNYSFYRLITSVVRRTEVPLPASGLLFLGALAGLGAMRPRSRAGSVSAV